MAITQTTTPIVKMTAQADQLQVNYTISGLYWISKTASAGDDLLILDKYDNTIWECVADGPNFTSYYPLFTTIPELKISVMDSGTLYIIKKNINETVYDYGA